MFIVGKSKTQRDTLMPYIKLLTVLAGLALLTACGGGTGLTATNDTITPECMTNPFGADCNKFAEALLLRESICIGESTSTRCTPIVTPICELDFNNALCRGRAKYDDLLAEATCAGTPACADGVITYADWVEIASPDATPNTTTRRNQFLQGDATTGLNVGTGYALFNGRVPSTLTIDFENGHPRILIPGIEGDATGGLALFRGEVADVNYYYVGILPNTNLGAPITTTTGTAKWGGRLFLLFANDHNFILDVDFGKREVSFPVSATNNFSLKGTWDERGVITGTTLEAQYLDAERTMLNVGHALNTPGILTGLIGQDGAVGVFHSNNDGIGTQPYIGGFIVVPPPPPDPCIALSNCAEFSAWESSFASGGVNVSQPLRDSGFTNNVTRTELVRATSDYIKLDGDNKIVTSGGTFTPNILRLHDSVEQDGYESGFAYAHDDINTTGQTYAGILATTNLGAPLIDDSKDGTWTGRLAGITGVGDSLGSNTAAFSLTVTFGGDSDVAGSVGTIKTEGTNGFASIDGNSNGIRLIGDFNAAGVMWGRMNLGGAVDDNGTFSGLIGAKGAVGVFEGVNPSFSFSGGFELHPPE